MCFPGVQGRCYMYLLTTVTILMTLETVSVRKMHVTHEGIGLLYNINSVWNVSKLMTLNLEICIKVIAFMENTGVWDYL